MNNKQNKSKQNNIFFYKLAIKKYCLYTSKWWLYPVINSIGAYCLLLILTLF